MDYDFEVFQGEIAEPLPSLTTPSGKDWLPFKLGFFTKLERRRGIYEDPDADDAVYEEPNLITGRLLLVELDDIKLLSRRDTYTGLMVSYLSDMGVPEIEQPPIIDEIFRVVDVAVPKLPIVVAIAYITIVLSGELSPPTIPAAGRGLAEVRLDSLDEATLTQTHSCVICLMDIEHQDMIIRLPCAHLYHADCILRWLERSHFCPMCRCSMPFVSDTELQPPILSGATDANLSISISEGSSSGEGADPSISEGSGSAQGANSSISESSSSGQGRNSSISEGSGSSQGANPSKSEASGSSGRRTPPLLVISAGGIITGMVTITLLCKLWKRGKDLDANIY